MLIWRERFVDPVNISKVTSPLNPAAPAIHCDVRAPRALSLLVRVLSLPCINSAFLTCRKTSHNYKKKPYKLKTVNEMRNVT